MSEDEERAALESAADRSRRAAIEWIEKGGHAEDLIGAVMFFAPTVEAANDLADIVEDIVAKRTKQVG